MLSGKIVAGKVLDRYLWIEKLPRVESLVEFAYPGANREILKDEAEQKAQKVLDEEDAKDREIRRGQRAGADHQRRLATARYERKILDLERVRIH